MKVADLSKKLDVKNKDLIDFFKKNNIKVSSHMQNLTNEQVEFAEKNFIPKPTPVPVEETPKKEVVTKPVPEKRVLKKFNPDDLIECRSVVPWKMIEIGTDGRTLYSWENYGDVEVIPYRELQAWRKRSIITDPKIIILDEDLCELWKHDLGNTYQKYFGVDYPEEFFDVDDDKFKSMLSSAPDVFKNVIKFTAMDMIHNENYPDLKKIIIVDEVLGTCIKEFL